MKIPRDLSARDLIRALEKLGYVVVRQSGSHIRLTCSAIGEHHVTIPNHSALRIGTLNAVLADVAAHRSTNRDELLTILLD